MERGERDEHKSFFQFEVLIKGTSLRLFDAKINEIGDDEPKTNKRAFSIRSFLKGTSLLDCPMQ
jgi:hypothetical protein